MRSRGVARKRAKGETPVSIRLEPVLLGAVRGRARREGKPVSRVIREMLSEAVRMQRFPGVVVVEGPAGRRAHLAGTGLDVWELIGLVREYGSPASLREHFPHLSPRAIQVAIAYAEEYPEEINAFLEANTRGEDRLRQEVPWLETVRS